MNETDRNDREASEGGISTDLAEAMVQAAAAATVSTDGRAVVYFSNLPSVANPTTGIYQVFRADDWRYHELPQDTWTLLYVVHRPDRAP
jgi:hypothetical protein